MKKKGDSEVFTSGELEVFAIKMAACGSVFGEPEVRARVPILRAEGRRRVRRDTKESRIQSSRLGSGGDGAKIYQVEAIVLRYLGNDTH